MALGVAIATMLKVGVLVNYVATHKGARHPRWSDPLY